MGTMRILDASGDTAVAFDTNDPIELERVRVLFDELIGHEKRLAFAHSGGGVDPVLIREFDPTAHEIVVTRALAGG